MNRTLACVLPLLLLLGCSPAELEFSRAYYLYQQGELQQSLLQYYHLRHSEDSDPLVDYNIGTVYLGLGEARAALEWWRDMTPPKSTKLAVALAYNEGIAAYNAGDAQQAREHFIAALRLNPNHYPSKINLELTLRSLQRNMASPHPALAPRELPQLDAQRLLDFVNREERWFNWEPEPSSDRQEDW